MRQGAPRRHERTRAARYATRQNSLCEALNRVLDTGAVVMGELVISVAGVDLLYLNLNLLITSVETLLNAQDRPTGAIVVSSLESAVTEPREAGARLLASSSEASTWSHGETSCESTMPAE